MSVSKLATALSVIFVVSLIALAGELLYVLWRRRSFHRHSSPPSPDQTPDSHTADAATKELLYFFCLKPHTRPVDLTGAPNKNTGRADESSPDDQVVDVFKLLEANGPSRFLCTIKEEEREDVESTHDFDFSNKSTTQNECLQQPCVQLVGEPVVEEEVAVTVDVVDDGSSKTVFSTPCDSPSFLTPVGSPSREFMESEFVVCVNEIGNSDVR